MDMLLKCIGVWLLILWHKENLWVRCDDDARSYSIPVGNDHNPKPVSTELSALFSSGNDTDELKKETDEVKLKGDSVNSTVVTEQNRAPEHIVSMEGGGGVTLHPDISHLDEGSISSAHLSDVFSAYNSSFPAVDHDNRTSSTVPRKGVTYKPNGQNYSLPTRNDHDPKSVSTDGSALFLSRNYTDKLQKETDHVESKGDISANSTVVTKSNRSGEYIVSMEGGGDVTLHRDFSHLDGGLTPSTELPGSLSTYHGSFFVIDHDNTTTSTVARKGVIYKPKIVPRKGVDSNIEGISTSIEGTDETVENNNHFLDKTCVCCLNNTLKLGNRNGSDDDCSKCCDTMQNGKNTSDTVSGKSETVEPVNVLSADSARNPTAEDSIPQNTSVSVKQDKHNSGSLNNTATSGTPLSRNKKPLYTLDAANDLPENLNMSSQSLAHDKELNRTDYVIPVVLVIFTVPLFVVLAVFLYKKSLELWERRHYRQMDFLIDGIYND